MSSKQSHIVALDGLRFIAAFSVMTSHAAFQIYPFVDYQAMSVWAWNLDHLKNFGMTLFFVLSGFVIHWNYRHKVQETNGLKRFFIARWSRLYPLFLVMFLLGLTVQVLRHGDVWRAMLMTPYFLTFTTSWWYWQPDGQFIFGVMTNPINGVMWSLATEAFFYCIYPFLAPSTAQMARGSALLAIVATGLVGALTSLAFIGHSGEIMAFGAKHLGASNGEMFLYWLGFYSPWMRFPSFLIGVFTAQLVLSGVRLKPFVADTLAILSLVAIAMLVGAPNGNGLFAPYSVVDTSAAVICFTGICLAASAERARIGTLLAAPLMISGGEASYSLYLLHTPIIFATVRSGIDLNVKCPIAWYLAVATIAIIAARLSYIYFERPAQSFFRTLGETLLRLPHREFGKT
jgi:peptidoglycan/LPS O-acetylase OafA/YrhL